MTPIPSQKLRDITSFPQLVQFLAVCLQWPLESFETDEITFEWDADDLKVSESQSRLLSDGVVRQFRPFIEGGQPWGIFVVEFNDDSFRRGALREILRGLVANRQRDASLPSWKHDNLLFICTTKDCQQITFAHYRGEKAHKAKLATFGWQKGSPYVRTLCEFNLPFLHWPDDPSDHEAWLKQWISAFDKEPLTKEFFKRFDKVLEVIQGDLQTFHTFSSAEAYSRAQLLLERMIFAYFLQNRGWLNRQRHYLMDHFSEHQGKPDAFSYYEDFLVNLFWTLSSAPGSTCRQLGIPYLNGGLFDDDEFNPAPNYRRINPPLRIRNVTFGFVFEHLLEAFNFTVREDTPINQDVAVDPEMLGKVFESIVLHAEAQADFNAPDKRKATGSYYTPRIVVHFICREALHQYLAGHLGPEWSDRLKVIFRVDATDGLDTGEVTLLKASLKPSDGQQLLEMLEPIKMCDPSVGSGAFPVGLLHELVNLRRIASTVAKGFTDPARREGSNWIHETKAAIVENCLYGVDIQQQAIEICRLRLWLSLIVDYDLGLDPFEADQRQFLQAIANISQLPNLEMNFRRGDSLLDLICDVPVRIETNARFEKDYEKIRKLGCDLHKAKKSERKRNLRVEILRHRLDLSERVVSAEISQLQNRDANLDNWFGASKSDADKRRQLADELDRLTQALAKLQSDRSVLEKIAARPMDSKFYPELRKLEGADFNAPFNFAWRIDYADIFNPRPEGPKTTLRGEFGLINDTQTQQEFTARKRAEGGFDLILGNPPFVTARNPEKRELYRARWKRVCSGKYLLVCPFFDLSFNLLRPGGQLGFIVSNAFAKREFGKPLIEDFFPTVDIQKIVDCSGLLFPGHGTPTCIVFGRNQKPDEKTPIRITATLPGGGDLRTQPEESPLWHAIAAQHDSPGYADNRINVADRPRKEMAKWPWNLESEGDAIVSKYQSKEVLADYLNGQQGVLLYTGSDDIYVQSCDLLRRLNLNKKHLRQYITGEDIRDWTREVNYFCIFPYQGEKQPIAFDKFDRTFKFLEHFKYQLAERIAFGRKPAERGLEWYEYSIVVWPKLKAKCLLAYPNVSTHSHFLSATPEVIFKEKAPILVFQEAVAISELNLIAGLLNSSASLFWLKQVCFNKGAGEDEERDRFEFSGGKVQQLPVPDAVAGSLRGKSNTMATRLQTLSQACWEHGHKMPALAMKKLFEKKGEAYHDWNSALPGYVTPDPRMGKSFQTLEELQSAFSNVWEIRETFRAEMIALQEEMDWLVYEAYGLIENTCSMSDDTLPEPLLREQRPFVLWQLAEGDFGQAVALIPANWTKERKAVWQSRLEAIRDNEHIRRIEAPVYKRRWDEQWKVGNSWQCGPVAYDAELVDAFQWWLSEKAEWWLENIKGGGPVDLDAWQSAIWSDARVQAAWDVVAESLKRLQRRTDFGKYFTALVKDQSVPEDIPFAVAWDKLPKSLKVSATTKRIRGKLNVPRERFRLTASGQYIWAGKS